MKKLFTIKPRVTNYNSIRVNRGRGVSVRGIRRRERRAERWKGEEPEEKEGEEEKEDNRHENIINNTVNRGDKFIL